MRTNGLRHASRLGLVMLVTLIGCFAFGQNAGDMGDVLPALIRISETRHKA